MRFALYLSAAVLVAVCATWTYRVNYATQDALNRLTDLRRAIAEERETLAVLNAEWAYLNRPDRLAALVGRHGAELGLVPLAPEHFGEAAMVAFPPEPKTESERLAQSTTTPADLDQFASPDGVTE